MSSPSNYTLFLTQDAQADLSNILLYTERQWDSDQRHKYAALLDTALHAIESNPQLGRPRPQLPAHYRIYHVGRHYIIYRLENMQIIVLRVLHDKMDIPRHI